LLRHLLRRQEPDCSAENRSSIAGRQADLPVPDSASPADHPRPALSQAAHAPNIPRAPGRADLQVLEAPQHRAHDPDLAHALDSERGQALPGRARAAQLRLAKLHAHSAPVRAAADAASNSIRRLKKAR